jgi:tetratricopeptide (TPR) repeat protein
MEALHAFNEALDVVDIEMNRNLTIEIYREKAFVLKSFSDRHSQSLFHSTRYHNRDSRLKEALACYDKALGLITDKTQIASLLIDKAEVYYWLDDRLSSLRVYEEALAHPTDDLNHFITIVRLYNELRIDRDRFELLYYQLEAKVNELEKEKKAFDKMNIYWLLHEVKIIVMIAIKILVRPEPLLITFVSWQIRSRSTIKPGYISRKRATFT